jgi:hypothetical protein
MEKKEIIRQVKRLKTIIPAGAKVAFYPSAGIRSADFDFSTLPLDFVICSDYNVKEQQKGKVITVKADNNLCLRFIIESGIKLDAFFSIQDGAIEGGNYEFVNSIGFIGRLLPALKDNFVLVSNIKNYFDINKGPVKIVKPEPEYLSIYRQDIYSGYKRDISKYEIYEYKRIYYNPKTILLKNSKKVIIHRKSIWQDQNELDAIFKGIKQYTESLKESIKNYWPENFKEDKVFDVFTYTDSTTIKPLLKFANKRGFIKVGLVPFAAGRNMHSADYDRGKIRDYSFIIDEFSNWQEEYPKEIHLYHLDKHDFESLYNL